MAHTHNERCSTTILIKEMKIKTLMRDHFTVTRMVVIKKAKDNKYW